MPPLDHKPMSIDVEQNPFDEDPAFVPVLSHNTSMIPRSCLRKATDECFDRAETRMKRSLQFDQTTSILWIEGIDSKTDEEIYYSHYSSEDYDGFRDRERRMSRNFTNWGFMKTGRKREADYLGVESRVQRFQRRQRTKNALFAVLLEQELYTETIHGNDPRVEADIAIARAYQQYTKESARLARERATVNASIVSKTRPRITVDEVEMDNGEESSQATKKKVETPWEVPAFKKTQSKKNRPADMVRYSTCSYLPSRYSGTFQCDEPNVLMKPSESFQYLYQRNQRKVQERGMLVDNDIGETPVKQKTIRAPDQYKFKHSMFHLQSRHPATTERHFPDLAQPWTWDQMPYDVVY